MIEYRCLDCGKRYPYGDLARERIETCPLCGYELVPAEEEDDAGASQASPVALGQRSSHSAPALIATFVGVSALILALAVLMPK
jgi:predicted  nucleic acid-binding Zn-ribbon protein